MTADLQWLQGKRILIVEDDALFAEALAANLEDSGCKVAGPVANLAQGLRMAERNKLDGAILDIEIEGGTCFPIARQLQGRGIPFVFLTGLDRPSVPAELRRVPVLPKPLDDAVLTATARELLLKSRPSL
jgi:DNA-binding response OmpR family regulator